MSATGAKVWEQFHFVGLSCSLMWMCRDRKKHISDRLRRLKYSFGQENVLLVIQLDERKKYDLLCQSTVWLPGSARHPDWKPFSLWWRFIMVAFTATTAQVERGFGTVKLTNTNKHGTALRQDSLLDLMRVKILILTNLILSLQYAVSRCLHLILGSRRVEVVYSGFVVTDRSLDLNQHRDCLVSCS